MGHATRREPLRESAAAWHDRVHRDDVTEETRAAFALWLAESPEHRAAYGEIDRTWTALKSTATKLRSSRCATRPLYASRAEHRRTLIL